jgi:hypothetical protein
VPCLGGDALAEGRAGNGSGFSSLLGGVLKGEIRASTEGRRGSGCRILVGGKEMALGFAGIFGFSARLTGGGAALGFSFCASGLEVSDRSTLRARGSGVEDRLECCDMSSRTLPNGVLSTRSGDLEALRSKKVRGGDRGESTLTEGVSCGEDCNSIDMGRRCPGLGGESVPLTGVCGPL